MPPLRSGAIGQKSPYKSCSALENMTERTPIFCVVLKEGEHWQVEAEWPDGRIEEFIKGKPSRTSHGIGSEHVVGCGHVMLHLSSRQECAMAEENVPPKLLPEQQAILDIVDELRLDIAVQRFLLRTLIGQRIGEEPEFAATVRGDVDRELGRLLRDRPRSEMSERFGRDFRKRVRELLRETAPAPLPEQPPTAIRRNWLLGK